MTDTSAPDGRLLTIYLLYFAGLVVACVGVFQGPLVAAIGGICLVLGAVLAWTVSLAPADAWRVSHGIWLFRMFWVLAVFGIFGWYTRIWLFGGLLLIVLWLWAMWRIGKGLLRWRQARAIERPETWF